jgi:hypothetical protein
MTATQEDLMKELHGVEGNPKLTPVDATPQDASEVGSDPFAVAPKREEPSAVKREDKVHAVSAGGKGYRVVVAGEYYRPAKEGKGRVADKYELSFNLPSLEAALSVIVGKLLLPALKRKYPGALGYRTHEIVSATPLAAGMPRVASLQFMDRAALEAYALEAKVPIDLTLYDEVTELRESLIDFQQNPDTFAKREEQRAAERRQMAELRQMNEGVV